METSHKVALFSGMYQKLIKAGSHDMVQDLVHQQYFAPKRRILRPRTSYPEAPNLTARIRKCPDESPSTSSMDLWQKARESWITLVIFNPDLRFGVTITEKIPKPQNFKPLKQLNLNPVSFLPKESFQLYVTCLGWWSKHQAKAADSS